MTRSLERNILMAKSISHDCEHRHLPGLSSNWRIHGHIPRPQSIYHIEKKVHFVCMSVSLSCWWERKL